MEMRSAGTQSGWMSELCFDGLLAQPTARPHIAGSLSVCQFSISNKLQAHVSARLSAGSVFNLIHSLL